MPLNREAIALSASPSAVAVARRWVTEVCLDLGRHDLVDCAELGVSELVTNAILHGEAPMNVRVRGTAAHPRIEVFDSSPHAPSVTLPDLDPDLADLETYGRGLSLVAMAASAWGAAIEDRGKIVWFEPARDFREVPTPGVLEEDSEQAWEPFPDSVEVHLLDVDTALLRSVVTQYANLRRELRLLAVAHHTDYPVARDLSPFLATFERQLPPGSIAEVSRLTAETQDPTVDITLVASPRSAPTFRTMLEMFELADSFCLGQRLLALARTPEQRTMQEWMINEFLRQMDGQPPQPWRAEMLDGSLVGERPS